ncbi:MAG: methionyl-tRNA synthetase [Polyangiaceae bacterium]|jgi:methionyl-tRNA synthetase|nr:methionyl-tRNA synthetase [Polyangiaceae bacterium]
MNDANFPLFVSSAIPYVNATPHVGHALELLLGDALSRHARQRGREVRFTGGTDDHSTKNARAAEARGLPTSELVRQHGETFRRLADALGVHFDDYVHTSRDARHAPCVYELWRRCLDAGDLYPSEYRGLYCAGCEAFVAETELVDGLCVAHREAPELVAERNWFFRLSRYQAPLLAALERDALRVEPRERHREVVSFVRAGLTDFSVSRSHLRARGWGLPVPNDPTQVIYVWFDALANYLSLLSFPKQSEIFSRFWSEAGGREHLIGKDVLRFHAVYWPAILLSSGLPLPTAIKTHGFVTAHGVKIGKSLGNTVDPFELVEEHGVSAVRFYFLRHLHSTKDSDFDRLRLAQSHDTELAGKLGNLLQRTVALALRYPEVTLCAGEAAESEDDRALREAAESTLVDVKSGFDDFALHRSLGAIFELVAETNRYAESQEPWTLSRTLLAAKTPQAAEDLRAQLSHVLWRLCESLRVTAVLLAPFLPEAAEKIIARLGVPSAELRDLSAARFGAPRRFRPRSGAALFPRRPRLLAAGDAPSTLPQLQGAAPGPVLPSS